MSDKHSKWDLPNRPIKIAFFPTRESSYILKGVYTISTQFDEIGSSHEKWLPFAAVYEVDFRT